MGFTLFDALTMWDVSSAEKPPAIIPGLATEWKVDDKDKTKWTFGYRQRRTSSTMARTSTPTR